MQSVQPSIDPKVAELAPGFRALSIMVKAADLTNPEVAKEALARACKSITTTDVPWAEAHLEAWAETFKKFGAKPQRTPCSASALRKRVLRDGSLPSIDPIVDLYNAISIQYAIPVGGENLAAYAGAPRLAIADGTELFDTMKMQQVLQTFFEESRELLEQMESILLDVESEAISTEQMNALFRTMHTIKGSAGLFAFDEIVHFSHQVEDVLDQLRSGTLVLSDALTGLLLQCHGTPWAVRAGGIRRR